ncbi:hypothetical protein CFC21_074142 [Triticum aestivum]|uniref:DUF1618 domain-containing protein n=3 Tax=Triticum TaxID=4564 RepID=A0A9R0XKZ0_TRITD|nr:hypothetical protein CFC21_074142 [Triticum aestivum]VAI38358.1 unnamed protein product [Triticum turgidum subsp. durum]
MATKAARSRPFLIIMDMVKNYDLLEDPGSLGLEVVECKRSAVGCGPTGALVLEGVSLYLVRGGDDDDLERYPRMCVRVSDQAFDLVSAEIDDRTADIWGRNLHMGCRVFSMQGDVMVISLVFIANHDPRPFRAYYLVYDSATTSLFMIPYPATDCLTIGKPCPLPVRRPDDGRYTLAFLNHEPDALCLWSLPPLPDNMKPPALPLPQNDMDPWVAKSRRPTISDRLDVHVVFSSKDYAFWVDLKQGILYCSISDMLNGEEPVDFKYIPLPKECSMPTDIMDAAHVHRNMGLDGDSTIWFVAIEPSENSVRHTNVKVWTLDLTQLMSKKKTKKWQKLREFKMQSIWRLYAFRKKGLPRTEPRFPVWRQERDGGILYMLLPRLNDRHGYLVGIHIGCSTSKMRLLPYRSLSIPWINHPVVLPSDFFTLGDTVV